MTEAEQQQEQPDEQLVEISEQVGKCPDCGKDASRVAARYPGKATLACADGHQWEVEITEKE